MTKNPSPRDQIFGRDRNVHWCDPTPVELLLVRARSSLASDPRQAAVAARSALETALREMHLAAKLRPPPPRQTGVGIYATALRRAGLLDRNEERRLVRYCETAHRAAHNYTFRRADAARFVQAVRQFCRDHRNQPSPKQSTLKKPS